MVQEHFFVVVALWVTQKTICATVWETLTEFSMALCIIAALSISNKNRNFDEIAFKRTDTRMRGQNVVAKARGSKRSNF